MHCDIAIEMKIQGNIFHNQAPCAIYTHTRSRMVGKMKKKNGKTFCFSWNLFFFSIEKWCYRELYISIVFFSFRCCFGIFIISTGNKEGKKQQKNTSKLNSYVYFIDHHKSIRYICVIWFREIVNNIWTNEKPTQIKFATNTGRILWFILISTEEHMDFVNLSQVSRVTDKIDNYPYVRRPCWSRKSGLNIITCVRQQLFIIT